MVSLPRPEPWTEERSARLPPPPAISTGRELDLDLDQSDAPPPALLLRCFVVDFFANSHSLKCKKYVISDSYIHYVLKILQNKNAHHWLSSSVTTLFDGGE